MQRKIKHPKRRKLYPPNVPKRLFQLFRSLGYSVTKLAMHVRVNSGHVSKLLNDGIEPSDTTELGRLIRQKLFLPKRKKKVRGEINRTIQNHQPDFIRTWKHLPTEERRNVIQSYLEYKKKKQHGMEN